MIRRPARSTLFPSTTLFRSYVHPRHHGLRTLDTGWFAKQDVFAYLRPEPPQFAPGGDGWLESTPPVLAPFQALAGLEITRSEEHTSELQSQSNIVCRLLLEK